MPTVRQSAVRHSERFMVAQPVSSSPSRTTARAGRVVAVILGILFLYYSGLEVIRGSGLSEVRVILHRQLSHRNMNIP